MALSSIAMAAEILPGPIPATLVRVIDGDTVEVRAQIWLGQQVQVAVRLAGIDAPELRSRCVAERERAEAAAIHLRPLEGAAVSLTNVMNDKYGRRIRADIHHVEMGALGVSLMNAGLARPYDGRRRESWCAEVAVRE